MSKLLTIFSWLLCLCIATIESTFYRNVGADIVEWRSGNPIIYAGLDNIHTAHINQLITELRKITESESVAYKESVPDGLNKSEKSL